MRNCLRLQRGFSLTELSFVLTIGLILTGVVAGGGSYLLNSSKSQSNTEFAKATMTALIQFEARRPSIRFPRPASQDDFDTGTVHGIGAFYHSTAGTLHYNPYTGTNVKIPVVPFPPGGTHVLVEQADYPLAAGPGEIYYFHKTTLAGAPILVWDGVSMKPFDYYAVQAVDDRGYPVFTMGR